VHALIAVVHDDLLGAGRSRSALGIGHARVLRQRTLFALGMHAPDAGAVGTHVQSTLRRPVAHDCVERVAWQAGAPSADRRIMRMTLVRGGA
jgi:hypothetical protein